MNALHKFSVWLYTRPPILLQGARHYFWRLMATPSTTELKPKPKE